MKKSVNTKRIQLIPLFFSSAAEIAVEYYLTSSQQVCAGVWQWNKEVAVTLNKSFMCALQTVLRGLAVMVTLSDKQRERLSPNFLLKPQRNRIGQW